MSCLQIFTFEIRSISGVFFIIGIINFLASIIGLQIGKKFGKGTGGYVEVLGGVVLIGIGVKILIEHLYF